MSDYVVTSQLGDAGPVIQIQLAEGADLETDVGIGVALPFDDLVRSVSGVASAMTDALRRARPNEAEVTFGVNVTVEAGHLTSLLVKGQGQGTLNIRLLWKDPSPDAH